MSGVRGAYQDYLEGVVRLHECDKRIQREEFMQRRYQQDDRQTVSVSLLVSMNAFTTDRAALLYTQCTYHIPFSFSQARRQVFSFERGHGRISLPQVE